MATPQTCHETIPEYAYQWRPFASRDMIYKKVVTRNGDLCFIVDPWNQRWLLASEPTPSLLKAADGTTRFSKIIRDMSTKPGLQVPAIGIVGLAEQLSDHGLLFNCTESHQQSGNPVYNISSLAGMHIEITNACNMTCKHCYVSSGKKMSGEMTTVQIMQTIDQLTPFTGKRVVISGGEPAIHKDCAQIVEYCMIDRGHDVDFYSNGNNFPRRLAEHFMSLNSRSNRTVRVQISLEGATAPINDAIRGNGSFGSAMSSLVMFKDVGINRDVVLFVCITSHNIHELDDIISLAEECDVGMLVFSQWQKQGNASDIPWRDIAPSTEEWLKAGEKLLKYSNPRLQIFGNFYGDLNNNIYGRYSIDGSLFPKHTYYYNSFPRISPDGDVWADQLWVDRDWVLGNVKEVNLYSCFETPKFQLQLEEMQNRSNTISECRSCDWKLLCEGGSPGHTYAEYDGDMNNRDLFCDSRIYWFERFISYHVEKAIGSGEFDIEFKRPPAHEELAPDNKKKHRKMVVLGS